MLLVSSPFALQQVAKRHLQIALKYRHLKKAKMPSSCFESPSKCEKDKLSHDISVDHYFLKAKTLRGYLLEIEARRRAGMQQVLPPARSGWKFSKRAVFGRGVVRVGLKTRPGVFALNRASMRDSPSK